MRAFIVFMMALLLAGSVSAAGMDDVFTVHDARLPDSILPGDTVNVSFTIRNYDLVAPDNVTAYIDPCPANWKCEEKTFSYEMEGLHQEYLTVKLPDYAMAIKYTAYILLRSEHDAIAAADNRVVFNVVDPSTLNVLSYEEYKAKQEAAKAADARKAATIAVAKPVAEDNQSDELNDSNIVMDAVDAVVNTTEVKQNVERLQTSSQFMEYLTVVLVVILVLIAAGIYSSVRKSRKKK